MVSLAVGLMEIKSLARGMLVADSCLKVAPVSLRVRTTCPGKSLLIINGEISAVQSAVEHGVAVGGDTVIASLVLGNIHPGVLLALAGTVTVEGPGALGIIETFSVIACIRAADTAAKAAGVELLDVRPAFGLGGKGLVLLTGSVGAVQAAVEAALIGIKEEGELVDAAVIPSPHPELWDQLG